MKKIKNAVTKHRIFTSINVTHINSRKKEVAHAGYGRSLPSAFSHGVSVPDVTDAPADVAEELAQETSARLSAVSTAMTEAARSLHGFVPFAKNQYLS